MPSIMQKKYEFERENYVDGKDREDLDSSLNAFEKGGKSAGII